MRPMPGGTPLPWRRGMTGRKETSAHTAYTARPWSRGGHVSQAGPLQPDTSSPDWSGRTARRSRHRETDTQTLFTHEHLPAEVWGSRASGPSTTTRPMARTTEAQTAARASLGSAMSRSKCQQKIAGCVAPLEENMTLGGKSSSMWKPWPAGQWVSRDAQS